jgi:hypothetical protein
MRMCYVLTTVSRAGNREGRADPKRDRAAFSDRRSGKMYLKERD